MGASKQYKGKDCAYCGKLGCSSTNDHVIARSFFLDTERGVGLQIPKVAACQRCNNEKSELEGYIGSTLLIGSKHPEANRYRSEKIRPRLDRNQKLRKELNIDSPPVWTEINGLLQPMHAVTVDVDKINRLLQFIVRGLYRHHYHKPLPHDMTPDVSMIRPEAEASMWASVSHFFPPEAPRINCDLGRGSFVYSGVQSPVNEGFTAWTIGLHGQIPLHGQDGSADHWWCMTRPTPEAVAAARSHAGRPYEEK
ncbi:HNH endonuclease [Methylosinus sp. KRF6]|uniref:HNH endonuclease n=1 Tax=Methylosinus sp. KRF6 TaxID=2846853 RepID=UPI001C0B31DA|nr:HNH endonuclease [Methylosinus sp. KRF6]MBU3890924.1 HNH endonuclease [Methylosinus sp. KRF6]